MSYFRKNNDNRTSFILVRVKEIDSVVVGEEYHLRKMIRIEGNTVFDEVHDIKVASIDNGVIKDENSGDSFVFSDFEFFKRK